MINISRRAVHTVNKRLLLRKAKETTQKEIDLGRGGDHSRERQHEILRKTQVVCKFTVTVYESVIQGFGSLIISDTDLTGEKKMKHADFVLYCDKS